MFILWWSFTVDRCSNAVTNLSSYPQDKKLTQSSWDQGNRIKDHCIALEWNPQSLNHHHESRVVMTLPHHLLTLWLSEAVSMLTDIAVAETMLLFLKRAAWSPRVLPNAVVSDQPMSNQYNWATYTQSWNCDFQSHLVPHIFTSSLSPQSFSFLPVLNASHRTVNCTQRTIFFTVPTYHYLCNTTKSFWNIDADLSILAHKVKTSAAMGP